MTSYMTATRVSRVNGYAVQALRELQRDERASQEGLAAAARVSAKTISAIERGTRDASWLTITRIAIALGVPPMAISNYFDGK